MSLYRLLVAYIEDLTYFTVITSGYITLGNIIFWLSLSIGFYYDNMVAQFLVALLGFVLISIGTANLAHKIIQTDCRKSFKRPIENTSQIPSILAYCYNEHSRFGVFQQSLDVKEHQKACERESALGLEKVCEFLKKRKNMEQLSDLDREALCPEQRKMKMSTSLSLKGLNMKNKKGKVKLIRLF